MRLAGALCRRSRDLQRHGASAGDFGDLKKICGPGSANGATAKGVTDSEIHIGVSADPGAAALPGLGQEFFDVGDAFTKWCNAAGGINGRKILLDKYDAKLFEAAAQIINACQKDFMLVGNGNAFDGPTVKPRLACKLAQIPTYTVSPAATWSLMTSVGPTACTCSAAPTGRRSLTRCVAPGRSTSACCSRTCRSS